MYSFKKYLSPVIPVHNIYMNTGKRNHILNILLAYKRVRASVLNMLTLNYFVVQSAKK